MTGVVAAGGGSATITVTPKAIPQSSAVPGVYGDTLVVTTTASGDAPHAVPLAQSAYGAILNAPPAALAFPATPAGGQSMSQVGITNTGNAPATLTWGAISNGAFTFDANVVLLPGGVTTTSNGYFAPIALTPYAATATMGVAPSTVLCQPIPAPVVALSGTGTNAPVVSVLPNPIALNSRVRHLRRDAHGDDQELELVYRRLDRGTGRGRLLQRPRRRAEASPPGRRLP